MFEERLIEERLLHWWGRGCGLPGFCEMVLQFGMPELVDRAGGAQQA